MDYRKSKKHGSESLGSTIKTPGLKNAEKS